MLLKNDLSILQKVLSKIPIFCKKVAAFWKNLEPAINLAAEFFTLCLKITSHLFAISR